VAETPVSRRESLRDALLNQLTVEVAEPPVSTRPLRGLLNRPTVEVAEERRSRVSKPPTN
jgi:hypothetical protein